MQTTLHCHFLPHPEKQMSWRDLNRHGTRRDSAYYISALKYSHYLWLQELPARAILALNRALYCPVSATEAAKTGWPLPYAALAWFLKEHQTDLFIGNPTMSYQHQAVRMQGSELKKLRAAACFWISRQQRPNWPVNPAEEVPFADGPALLLQQMNTTGTPEEAELLADLLTTVSL